MTLIVQPAVLILAIVATVHVVRDALVDAAVCYAVLLALLLEHRWLRRRVEDRPGSGISIGRAHAGAEVAAVGAIAVAFGLLAGPWQTYTSPLKIAMGALGVLVAVLVFTRRPPTPGDRPTSGRRYWPWAALGVAICMQELASFLQQPDPQTGSLDHPTLSVLIDPLLQSPLVRACVLAAWLAGGYVLARLAGLTARRAR